MIVTFLDFYLSVSYLFLYFNSNVHLGKNMLIFEKALKDVGFKNLVTYYGITMNL